MHVNTVLNSLRKKNAIKLYDRNRKGTKIQSIFESSVNIQSQFNSQFPATKMFSIGRKGFVSY